MGFLEELFLPPSSDHLHLAKYIVLLIYFIHFPFISLMLGGTFFSLIFKLLSLADKNPLHERIARDWANLLIFRKTAGIILGVLPLVTLVLVEGQIFYDANIYIVRFMLYTTILVATGITLVYFYQNSLRLFEEVTLPSFIAGGLGVLFIFLGYFIFSAGTALILDPGRWAVVSDPTDLLFSWNVIARSLHFLFAAFAVSGAAFLFLFFNWKETPKSSDNEYNAYVAKVSGGITLGFTLLQPVLIVWNLVTLPKLALSVTLFSLSVVALVIILFIVINLYKYLLNFRAELGTRIFILFVITFLIMIGNDHLARERATENHSQLLITRSQQVKMTRDEERRQKIEGAVKVDLTLGKQVFTNQCSSCHRFDQRIVGPPYNTVLPKYQDNQEALLSFIRNPKKVDDSYPPMPKLGLSEAQIRSVAAYLLKEFQEQQ